MRANPSTYRGYCIDVFAKGKAWHFSASPITPDLPILKHRCLAFCTTNTAFPRDFAAREF